MVDDASASATSASAPHWGAAWAQGRCGGGPGDGGADIGKVNELVAALERELARERWERKEQVGLIL